MKHFLIIFLLVSGIASAQPWNILVIGTSREYGLSEPAFNADSAWPKRLQRLLVNKPVTNCGVVNTTYTNIWLRPFWSYWNVASLKQAKPNLVIIGGPINDARTNLASYDAQFMVDYSRLIDSLRKRYGSHVRLVAQTAIKATHAAYPKVRTDSLNARVRRICAAKGVGVMSLDTIGLWVLGTDGVHIHQKGNAHIARIVKRYLIPEGPRTESVPTSVQLDTIVSVGFGGLFLKVKDGKRSLFRK